MTKHDAGRQGDARYADPNVAPFPPHISLKQAQAFGMSLLKGDSEEGGIIKQALHQLFPSIGNKDSD